MMSGGSLATWIDQDSQRRGNQPCVAARRPRKQPGRSAPAKIGVDKILAERRDCDEPDQSNLFVTGRNEMFEFYEPMLDEISKQTAKLVIKHLEGKKTIQPEYFTVEDAGLYIGKTKDGMTALLKQRLIPIIKIGPLVHIAKKDFNSFMLNHRQ